MKVKFQKGDTAIEIHPKSEQQADIEPLNQEEL
jgi:hypothetical protein